VPPTSELILASTSPYRRALLERLGVPFRCVAPDVDEHDVPAGCSPDDRARLLARRKAERVAAREPAAVVIGSDQVCALGDRVLHKPGTEARAREQLAAVEGQTHRLVTAVAVLRGRPPFARTFEDVTTLRARRLDAAAIARYVDADRPLDCAGAYRIESRGIALFEQIDSADHTAIVGLPLIALTSVLRELGWELP
jgi:septum formation protein